MKNTNAVIATLKSLPTLTCNEFIDNDFGTAQQWNAIRNAPSGRITIRHIDSGGEYFKPIIACTGTTPFLIEGWPLVVEFNDGYIKTPIVNHIDWHQGLFIADNEYYSFQFIK